MTNFTARPAWLRKSISILAIPFMSLAISAGETNNIRGTVLDPSGRAIEGAAVSCQGRTAFSNVDGRFALSLSSACELTIKKTGFQTKRVEFNGNGVRIQLELQGPVETVVVSATRAQTTPEQAAVAANVVSEQQFQIRDYPMIFDVLREIPGLQVSDSGRRGALTSVYTRGAERTGTLVLLDGVPLND